MAPSPNKGEAQAYPAEISLVQLGNCMVNLPSALTAVLEDANIVSHSCWESSKILIMPKAAQNVIVEVRSRNDPSMPVKPMYAGWTGMSSRRKLVPVVGKNTRTGAPSREREVALLEVDATFGKLLGFVDGMKVRLLRTTDMWILIGCIQ